MLGFTRVYKPTNDEINNVSEYCKLVFFGKSIKTYRTHMELLQTLTKEWGMEAIVKACHSVLLWSLENCSVPSNTQYHIEYCLPKYNNHWRGSLLSYACDPTEKSLCIIAPFGLRWEAVTNKSMSNSGLHKTRYPYALIKEFNGLDFWIDVILHFAKNVF